MAQAWYSASWKRLYEKMVEAVATRTVTSGERSIWTLFHVCSSRFLDGTGADFNLFNILK